MGIMNNNNNKKQNKKKQVPKYTAQETIPYSGVYGNGIIESESGRFSKAYFLGDSNFTVASESEQENTFSLYQKFLNSFPVGTAVQVCTYNTKIDEKVTLDNVLVKKGKADGLDVYRDEFNGILKSKLLEGNNNMHKQKYIVVSIEAPNVDKAVASFEKIDKEINMGLRYLSDKPVVPMSLEERLELMYNIYNPGSEMSFSERTKIGDKEVSAFDIPSMIRQGITTKDLIAPDCIDVNTTSMKFGDDYVRVLYAHAYPNILSTNFIQELSDLSFNMITSVMYEVLPVDKVSQMLTNRLTNINASIIEKQKNASRNGYSTSILPPNLQKSKDETEELLRQIQAEDQRIFWLTFTVAVYGKSKEDLDENCKVVESTAGKYLVGMRKLSFQQEGGFEQTFPIAEPVLSVQRMFTTEAGALYLPFSSIELSHPHGLYYGLNGVSKNLIMYDRTQSKNTNGCILGVPGSGKSFSAKREMLNVLLATGDDVYVIDPEREYAPMADMLGGEIVVLKPSEGACINPFDMDIDYGDEGDPVSLKSDFIVTMCETVVGGRGLSAVQRSIVDRCVQNVYKDYMSSLEISRRISKSLTIDKSKTPTMVDFYHELLKQPESDARQIALAFEIYAKGTIKTFSGQTNVDTKKRFVVYDIKDMGANMKELGIEVCLNDIWNKTIQNKKKGKRTWFYIDEFYLLVQHDNSAKFLQEIFKRSRKWGGCPTGITQNVEDMLSSIEARTIISNCDFVMMLNQSPIDGAELKDMFNISESQMSFITNSGPGRGLICAGGTIVPFEDNYPEDTKTFKAMTTRFSDIMRYKSYK